MPDDAEMAAAIEADRIAAGLQRIASAVPPGVPGECDNCGESMPRLVGGRCGFCRDGRRPPAERYAAAQAKLATPSNQEKTMPTPTPTPEAQTISVPATGAELDAIRLRAKERDLPLGRAALSLITELMDGPVTGEFKPGSVDRMATADLLDELAHRLGIVPAEERVAAAEARAASAEAKLAMMGGILSGHIVPAALASTTNAGEAL